MLPENISLSESEAFRVAFKRVLKSLRDDPRKKIPTSHESTFRKERKQATSGPKNPEERLVTHFERPQKELSTLSTRHKN